MSQRMRGMVSSRWWKITPLLAVMVGVGCNTKGNENRDQEYGNAPTIAPTPGPQPTFTTTSSLTTAPPPIAGGTMAIAKDGRTIVAADADRDRIYVVDIPSRTVKHSIKVADGAEPGRVAFDEKGHAFVALRSSGNVATVDLAAGTVSERHVCSAPRGLAYDAAADTLHVACMDGFLASIPLAGGDVRRIELDRDLRDVIVTKSKILVSRFRNADVIVLSRAGEIEGKSASHGGNLAWRMVKAPPPPTAPEDPEKQPQEEEDETEPVIISQDPNNPVGPSGLGYYGSGASDACSAPTITPTRLDIPGRETIQIPPAVLPVDLATNGREYAIVAAGNGHTAQLPQLFIHRVKLDRSTSSSSSSGFSGSGSGFGSGFGTNVPCVEMDKGFIPGQAIAAVYDGEDQLIVQSREPASLFIMSPDRQRAMKEIKLSDESREDTGHAIFHSNSGGFLACASCHAEGAEDGRTWTFIEGQRRTPSMRGTIKDTAPFHWDGSVKDMDHLVDFVFSTRMSGPKVDKEKVATLQAWLERVPAPPKLEAKDAAAVGRGQQLFAQQGCATCHAGSTLTNNETRDVGTGAAFQVPSLIGIGWRAPYLHNGCAKTMKQRFDGSCGGDKHGDTAGMTAAQIADLSAYVETL